MDSNAPKRLNQLGQSLWLDNITRDLLDSGTLKRYIDEMFVTGLTSNPTIFDNAISSSSWYDAEIRQQLNDGKSGEDVVLHARHPGPVAGRPICSLASMSAPAPGRRLRLAWRSRRCSPTTRRRRSSRPRRCTPRRTGPTCSSRSLAPPKACRRSRKRSSPASRSTSRCCSPPDQYLAAADAYMKGLERRVEAGLSPDVRSVASLFISRWDARGGARGAGRTAQHARHRGRHADLQGLSRHAGERPLSAPGECRRAARSGCCSPAPAQGQEAPPTRCISRASRRRTR